MTVWGITFLLLFGFAVAEPCHEPDVSAAGSVAALAGDVCRINSALGSSPPDYATVKGIYSGALKTVATADRDTPRWQKFEDFFGGPGWMDKIITAACDGDAPFTTDVKRVQVIKKVLQGTLLTQEMCWHLETGLNSANNGDFDAALKSWDRAMAAFYGVDVDCAPWGNGQARGIEFAKMTQGVAQTNYRISDCFFKGAQALKDKDAKGVSNAIDCIKREIKIIYIQSVAKYANLIDQGREKGDEKQVEKAQAEGFGYLHAILPCLAEKNSGGADALKDTFNVGNDPSEEDAEEALRTLRGFYAPWNIQGDVGRFDGSRSKRFKFPETIACPAENPFAGSVGATFADADK